MRRHGECFVPLSKWRVQRWVVQQVVPYRGMHRGLDHKLTSISRQTEFDKQDVMRLVERLGTLSG